MKIFRAKRLQKAVKRRQELRELRHQNAAKARWMAEQKWIAENIRRRKTDGFLQYDYTFAMVCRSDAYRGGSTPAWGLPHISNLPFSAPRCVSASRDSWLGPRNCASETVSVWVKEEAVDEYHERYMTPGTYNYPADHGDSGSFCCDEAVGMIYVRAEEAQSRILERLKQKIRWAYSCDTNKVAAECGASLEEVERTADWPSAWREFGKLIEASDVTLTSLVEAARSVVPKLNGDAGKFFQRMFEKTLEKELAQIPDLASYEALVDTLYPHREERHYSQECRVMLEKKRTQLVAEAIQTAKTIEDYVRLLEALPENGYKRDIVAISGSVKEKFTEALARTTTSVEVETLEVPTSDKLTPGIQEAMHTEWQRRLNHLVRHEAELAAQEKRAKILGALPPAPR